MPGTRRTKGTGRLPKTVKSRQNDDKPYVCENPNCGYGGEKTLRTTEVEGYGKRRLCATCYSYARRHNVFRSKEMADKTKAAREKRKYRSDRCHNLNCRTTHLEGARYSKRNGYYYCSKCALYVDSHFGEERPKSRINEELPGVVVEMDNLAECQNPNCGKITRPLKWIEVGDKGQKFRLCGTCYQYVLVHHKMRSAELVQMSGMHKQAQTVRCSNKNCRTTDMMGRGYYKGVCYCKNCCAYLTLNEGAQRPKEMILKHAEREGRRSHCENPNCGVALVKKGKAIGDSIYCGPCYRYALVNNGKPRPKDIVDGQKWFEPKRAHNVAPQN